MNKEYVPLLIDHFLETYSTAFGKRIAGVSRDVMSQILDYRWPGNVRELEHAADMIRGRGRGVYSQCAPRNQHRRPIDRPLLGGLLTEPALPGAGDPGLHP